MMYRPRIVLVSLAALALLASTSACENEPTCPPANARQRPSDKLLQDRLYGGAYSLSNIKTGMENQAAVEGLMGRKAFLSVGAQGEIGADTGVNRVSTMPVDLNTPPGIAYVAQSELRLCGAVIWTQLGAANAKLSRQDRLFQSTIGQDPLLRFQDETLRLISDEVTLEFTRVASTTP